MSDFLSDLKKAKDDAAVVLASESCASYVKSLVWYPAKGMYRVKYLSKSRNSTWDYSGMEEAAQDYQRL